jgi:hypothetical protein
LIAAPDLRLNWRAVRLAPAVIVCVSTLEACAPLPPARSWPELGHRLSSGSPVEVTDASGSEVRGRVASVSADSLTLKVGITSRELDVATIREVRRDGDPLWNGAAIGAAVGAAGALLSDSSCSRPGCGTQIPQRLTFVAVMTAAGAALDALHRDRTVLYRAPSPTALRIVSAVTPRRAEVSMVLDFSGSP